MVAMLREQCKGIVIKELVAGNEYWLVMGWFNYVPSQRYFFYCNNVWFPDAYLFSYISGHCPHDEQPENVNSIIQEWVVTIEREKFL